MPPREVWAAVGLSLLALAAVVAYSSPTHTSLLQLQLDEYGKDDYRDLLKREKTVLHSGAHIDWGNQKFLANAAKEQDAYVESKNKQAVVEGKQTMRDAAKLYSKWNDPYKKSQWAKYDTEKLPVYRARQTQLSQLSDLEAATSKLRAKAQASCNGDLGCEQVLNQVMGMFHK